MPLKPEPPSAAGFAIPTDFLDASAALVVAHPGHELRVYGWLKLARPAVFVLTDGSGHTGRSRLDSTTALLAEAGAEPGCVYGRLTDSDLYRIVIDHDFDTFTKLAEELAEVITQQQPSYVVGDAMEGYNPAHDVCRMTVNAALELAQRRVNHQIANFDFLLRGSPDACPETHRHRAICLRLDEATHNEKLASAAAYSELTKDVGRAFGDFGADAFRIECLRPVDDLSFGAGLFDEPPFYEAYGEKQVAAGYYKRVLRYREHMVPLAKALRRYVEQR